MIFIFLLCFSEGSQFNFSNNFFGIERKITIHHPRIVSRFYIKNNLNSLSFMLAKIENFNPVFIKDYSSGEINISVKGAEISKFFNIILQVFILSLIHI